jgi:DnaJ-class molecular chaperone
MRKVKKVCSNCGDDGRELLTLFVHHCRHNPMQHRTTLYETLEVSPTASARVIKAAYRCLAQFNHPDKNPDAASCERLARINQAYSVLSDPQQRQRYDLSLAWHERTIAKAMERRGRSSFHCSQLNTGADAHQTVRTFAFRPLD